MVEVSREPRSSWFRTTLTCTRLLRRRRPNSRCLMQRRSRSQIPNITIMDKFPRSLIRTSCARRSRARSRQPRRRRRHCSCSRIWTRTSAVVLFKVDDCPLQGSRTSFPKSRSQLCPITSSSPTLLKMLVRQLSLQHSMITSTSDFMQRLSSVRSKPRRCSNFVALATGLGQCLRISSLL